MSNFMKKFRLPLTIIAATAIVAGISISVAKASAASPPQSITISPTSIDQSVQPGSVNNGSFQVINSGDTSYSFSVYAAPYGVKGEDYNPEFTTPLPGAANVTDWFHFSNVGTSIGGHQTINVNYTIKVPAGTPPRGYYAVAFAQTKSPPSKTTGVVITDRVGEIFYLRVAGNATQSGKLLDWKAGFLQKPPLTAAVRLENDGSYNFPATINLNVKNIFGHEVYKFNTVRQVLPQTTRRITIPWQAAPSIGIFKVSGTAGFLNQTKQLPTKYVLIVSQSIRLIVLVIVVLLLLAVIYRWSRRRHAKR
jgi:hypothetical protein